MANFFFELPWWVVAGLVLVGVAIFMSGNARVKSDLKAIGIGVILLGITSALVSYYVDTDRESVEKRTRKLVDSVVANDWATMGSLLDDKAHIGAWVGRDELVRGTKRAVDEHGLKSARMSGLTVVVVDGSLIRATFQVSSEHNNSITVPSKWQLDWMKTNNQWLATEVTPVDSIFPGVSAVIQRITSTPAR